MTNWETYAKVHANRKPREQLVRAVAFCDTKESALDLGAGTLVESMYLLEAGFVYVTAVDSSPQSKEFASHIDSDKFTLVNESFNNFVFETNTYDFINAQYALPFHGQKDFNIFIDQIIQSLKPGGVFVGQLFGNRDEWNKSDTKLAFQTKEEAWGILSSLELIEFVEEEKEGATAAGTTKHWHVFHFIARKK